MVQTGGMNMRLVVNKKELLDREGDGYFNNEVVRTMDMVTTSEGIDEALFTGFVLEDVRELLFLIREGVNAKASSATGKISFEQDGILYRKADEKIHVDLDYEF